MTNIYKLSSRLALVVSISVLGMFAFGLLVTETVSAQDGEYYQDVEDNYEAPQYDDSLETDFDESEPQNPDPEFMDEI